MDLSPHDPQPEPADIAQWLAQAQLPSLPDTRQLFAELYRQLHRLAHGQLRRENAELTISATALTHEAFERMAVQHSTHWKNQSHFLAVASTMMRRILIDHAHAKKTAKREALHVTLSVAEQMPADAHGPNGNMSVLDLDAALASLARQDARAARAVEMRYFGGMTLEEVAVALDISSMTVKRDWAFAKTWLRAQLTA